MENIIEAYNLLDSLDKKPFKEVVKDFEDYSKQTVCESAIHDFNFLGMTNTDFLFSDYLNRYGLKNLNQLSISKPTHQGDKQNLILTKIAVIAQNEC